MQQHIKFTPELMKGSTKTLILAIVSHDDAHGYHIIREIRRKSADALVCGEGSIYPALHALEKDGLISGSWDQSDSGHERKQYRITKKGQRALKTALREWKQFVNAVNKVVRSS